MRISVVRREASNDKARRVKHRVSSGRKVGFAGSEFGAATTRDPRLVFPRTSSYVIAVFTPERTPTYPSTSRFRRCRCAISNTRDVKIDVDGIPPSRGRARVARNETSEPSRGGEATEVFALASVSFSPPPPPLPAPRVRPATFDDTEDRVFAPTGAPI